MKFSLPLIFIIVNFIFSTSSNNRLGAGLDIGSKGSGIFFNYLLGKLIVGSSFLIDSAALKIFNN